MRRIRLRRPSPSMAVALLALLVALGGTATAASVVLIKNSKQVAKGAISLSDLSASAQKALKGKTGAAGQQGPAGTAGPAGAAGATGAAGARGPSNAYGTYNDAGVDLTAGAPNLLTLSLPAGKFVIIGKLMLNNNDSTQHRPNCAIAAGGDIDQGMVGVSENARNDDTAVATFTVLHTFASAGSAVLSCDAATNTFALNRKITAIEVETLSNVAGM